MNKYYSDFFKEKLKQDVIHELIKQGMDEIFVYKEVNLYFETNEIQFDEIQQTSNTHQIRPRSAYQDKQNRCKARVWNEGEGGQCSNTGLHNGFCKTHFKKGGDSWWLGTVDKPRLERMIHPDGKIHYWN